jgi:chemotaxis protein CheD
MQVMSNEDQKIIDIPMSEICVSSNDHILRSSGIGSCIVITLYDSMRRIGALAHPMLPAPDLDQKSFRYIEPAIDTILSELQKLGAAKEELEAKLVGGASMFKVFDENPGAIGTKNVEAAKKKLENESIKIVANDTGGNVGRTVIFDLTTGLVEVKTKI